jgi:hypothetical protein
MGNSNNTNYNIIENNFIDEIDSIRQEIIDKGYERNIQYCYSNELNKYVYIVTIHTSNLYNYPSHYMSSNRGYDIGIYNTLDDAINVIQISKEKWIKFIHSVIDDTDEFKNNI